MSKIWTTFKSGLLRFAFKMVSTFLAMGVAVGFIYLSHDAMIKEWGMNYWLIPLFIWLGGGMALYFGITHWYLHYLRKPTETVKEEVKPAIEEQKPIGPAERPAETDQSKSRIRRRRRRR